MKVFKKLNTAQKHAQGGLILSVRLGGEQVYIVGKITCISEFAVLQHNPTHDSWAYAGQITAGHLVRLGNGNWAIAKNGDAPTAHIFP